VQIHEQGRKAVVLIDEAQMLETRELMEEFRGLLNLEVPERKLISFVFFGCRRSSATSAWIRRWPSGWRCAIASSR
jgi:hypothetical protein